jgi:hypothetical protein
MQALDQTKQVLRNVCLLYEQFISIARELTASLAPLLLHSDLAQEHALGLAHSRVLLKRLEELVSPGILGERGLRLVGKASAKASNRL